MNDLSADLSGQELLRSLQERQLALNAQNGALRSAQLALNTRREHYQHLFEYAPVAYLTLNADGLITEANVVAGELLGADPVKLLLQPFSNFVATEFADTPHLNGGSDSLKPHDYDIGVCRSDASSRHVQVNSIRSEDGTVRLTLTDITVRHQQEHDLRIAAIAFESQDGIFLTDENHRIIRVNRAFTRITGYSEQECIGQTPRLLRSDRHDDDFYALMQESIENTGGWSGEIWNKRQNGEVYPAHLTITADCSQNGLPGTYFATLVDITNSKLAEDEIRSLAFYDPLTQLPNRRLLLDRLQQALSGTVRSNKKGALLFIDLDNFKSLNDTLGHHVGDMLLQQVAERLRACVREDDTVARLGGDEFVVVLEGLSTQVVEAAAQTEIIGNKILTALNLPYLLGVHEHRSTPSIGITLFNEHDCGMEDLLKQADIAMYQAKKAGRNTWRFFDPKMQESINARVKLEAELRHALEQQQFQLFYQIQVDSMHRQLGAEALIRWIHPERGIIFPVEFIPLAEEIGLILPIGKWVLETAFAQLKAWQASELTRDLVLAVNVSAKQFREADFVAQVNSALHHYNIDPKLFKLELTESLLLDSLDDTIATMGELSAIGVKFSLDDFGTGYSSLQYLKQLPLDQLKIDQSFVRNVATDQSDKAIVRTVIAMAQSMNLNAIAEGVETEDQRQFLIENGCTHYQGYLFSKPVALEEFESLLKELPKITEGVPVGIFSS